MGSAASSDSKRKPKREHPKLFARVTKLREPRGRTITCGF